MQENINIPDSNISASLTFRQLVLMNMRALTNFPYIEKDFDALTDYELLCLVVKYLNDVIANQNEQNNSITSMYNAFLSLQTYVNNTKNDLETAFNNLDNYVRYYFDNLDVQEEINNKLDDMIEDGTLQEIITSYIDSNVTWTFDTVADMQQGSNLIVGSYAQTLGYYSINDEGASKFKIVSSADENEYQIQVGNLYANLLRSDTINIHQFGVKGDGTTDDTDNINKAYTFAANKSVPNINFGKNKTYMVRGYEVGQPEGSTTALQLTTGIILPSNTTTDMCDSTLKIIPNSRQNYNGFTIMHVDNVILKNGKVVGDVGYHTGLSGQWGYGVTIRDHCHNIKLENLYLTKCWGDGIDISWGESHTPYNENIKVINCICDDNRRQGMSIENGTELFIKDCEFINTGTTAYTSPASGVDIEPLGDSIVKNAYFENCLFNNNYSDGLTMTNTIENITLKDCQFIGNRAGTSDAQCDILNGKNIVFDGCLFGDNSNNFGKFAIQPSGDLIFRNNIFYDGRLFCSSNHLNNGTIKFINNIFYRKTTTTTENAFIQTYTTNISADYDNNTLIIDGNQFLNISGNRKLVCTYIRGAYNSNFKTLICNNNIFKDGQYAIRTYTSSIITNNRFITTYSYPIYLVSSDYNDYLTNFITNNIFEQCSYAQTTSGAGLLLTTNNKNINITDNILYRKPLNLADLIDTTIQDPINEPTRFTSATGYTGGSQNERNVILEN